MHRSPAQSSAQPNKTTSSSNQARRFQATHVKPLEAKSTTQTPTNHTSLPLSTDIETHSADVQRASGKQLNTHVRTLTPNPQQLRTTYTSTVSGAVTVNTSAHSEIFFEGDRLVIKGGWSVSPASHPAKASNIEEHRDSTIQATTGSKASQSTLHQEPLTPLLLPPVTSLEEKANQRSLFGFDAHHSIGSQSVSSIDSLDSKESNQLSESHVSSGSYISHDEYSLEDYASSSDSDDELQISTQTPKTLSQRTKVALLLFTKFVISFASATSTGAWAAAVPVDGKPSDILTRWPDLSSGKKTQVILFGASSFIINFLFPLYFIERAYSFVRYKLLNKNQTRHEFAVNLLIASLGLAAAAASAVVAWDSVAWFGSGGLAEFAAAVCTAVNFTTYLMSRTYGSQSAINTFIGKLVPRYRKQLHNLSDIVRHLEHIHPSHRQAVQNIIRQSQIAYRQQLKSVRHADPQIIALRKKQAFNDEITEIIFAKLTTYFKSHPDLVNEPSTLSSSLQAVKSLAIPAATLSIGAAIFVTFAPKGFKGFEKALNLLQKSAADLNNPSKILIGSWSGLASSLLYMNSALSVTQATADTVRRLYREKNFIGFSVFVAATLLVTLSSASMLAVSESNLHDPASNLFDINFDSMLGQWLVWSTTIGGGITNYVPTLALSNQLAELLSHTVNALTKRVKKPELLLTRRSINSHQLIYTLQNHLQAINVTRIPDVERKLAKQKKFATTAKIDADASVDIESQPAVVPQTSTMTYVEQFNLFYSRQKANENQSRSLLRDEQRGHGQSPNPASSF